jgi:hypothetical protein
VPKERPKGANEQYYPTAVGAEWVYVDGNQEYTEEVTAVQEEDGAKVVTVVLHRGGGRPSFESKKVLVSDKGLFEIASGGMPLDKPECFLTNPPNPATP